jgi:hypothetical protein
VAAYSLLLLASLLAHGFQRTDDYWPLPKWRTQSARPSTADLINLLRQQILGHTFSSDHKITFDHFAEIPDPNPKWQKLRLSSVGPPSWAHLAGPQQFSGPPQPNYNGQTPAVGLKSDRKSLKANSHRPRKSFFGKASEDRPFGGCRCRQQRRRCQPGPLSSPLGLQLLLLQAEHPFQIPGDADQRPFA